MAFITKTLKRTLLPGLLVCALSFPAHGSLLGGLFGWGSQSSSDDTSTEATAETTSDNDALENDDTDSDLNMDEAVGSVTAQILGEQLPAPLAHELARFMEERDPDDPDQSQAFAERLVPALFSTAINGPAVDEDDPIAELMDPDPSAPILDRVWDVYGLTRTIGFVGTAFVLPDLTSFVLPSNIRVVSDYVRSRTSMETTGTQFVPYTTTGIREGDSFTVTTTLDVDTFMAIAFEHNLVTDLLVLQVPLSTSAAVTTTCTADTHIFLVGRVCTNVKIRDTYFTNDKVLATNPEYRFAFPINAGQFATRATAQDVFQSVYDIIGRIHSQKERDPIAASPFANIPGLEALAPGTGLADLATQAPGVNFFGIQTNERSLENNLLSGLLNPVGDLMEVSGVDIRRYDHERRGGIDFMGTGELLLNSHSVVDGSIGVTAGYRAEEVRAGQINLMAIRWHNVGLSTLDSLVDDLIGTLPLIGSTLSNFTPDMASTPATIFYDVPEGEYSLTDDRRDAGNAVYLTEWDMSGEPPRLSFPPRLFGTDIIGNTTSGLLGLLGIGS